MTAAHSHDRDKRERPDRGERLNQFGVRVHHPQEIARVFGAFG